MCRKLHSWFAFIDIFWLKVSSFSSLFWPIGCHVGMFAYTADELWTSARKDIYSHRLWRRCATRFVLPHDPGSKQTNVNKRNEGILFGLLNTQSLAINRSIAVSDTIRVECGDLCGPFWKKLKIRLPPIRRSQLISCHFSSILKLRQFVQPLLMPTIPRIHLVLNSSLPSENIRWMKFGWRRNHDDVISSLQ